MQDSGSSDSIRPEGMPANDPLLDPHEFLTTLSGLSNLSGPDLSGFLSWNRPLHIARAPGRLDLMGGIADYSGSLVLQMPIREATYVAVQETNDSQIVIGSLPPPGSAAKCRVAGMPKRAFERLARQSYEQTREHYQQEHHVDGTWYAYPFGVLIVLWKELGWRLAGGLSMFIQSSVPESKGVSSSAALEVAAMRAVCQMSGLDLSGTELARLCQVAENRVVGAPCGIMDQMTSALGQQDELLKLCCQPADVIGFAALPATTRVWGIDSGIRHAVSGSDYTAVRTGAFMGYRMIADMAGLRFQDGAEPGRVTCSDPCWQGYLANIRPDVFESKFAKHLPSEISGREFLKIYGGTTDEVTRVAPGTNYAIRQPTAHPIYEHARVQRFAELLENPLNDQALQELGELMYASHDSYSACGLGSEGTDQLVEYVRQAGPEHGLFGAKITGGGSGGTVAVLGRADAEPVVQQIAARYQAESGRVPHLFSGSSPGAVHFPKFVVENGAK